MSQHRDHFMKLAAQEPALLALLRQVRAFKRAARDRTDVCANRIWCEHLKPALTQLVGWSAANPALRDSHAYDTAYRYLYELLPDCRNCGCVRMQMRVKPTPAARRLSSKLGGAYLHFLKDGRVRQQGRIVDAGGSVAEVLLFEWFEGSPTHTRWYHLEELRQCRRYRDADTWRAAAAMDPRAS